MSTKSATPARNGGPPVLLLGGSVNALSVARSLSRQAVRVYAMNRRTSHIRFSRFAHWIPVPPSLSHEQWLELLLSDRHEAVEGAVLLPCDDDALELIARHRESLSRRYIPIEANDGAVLQALDKVETYAIAQAAGIPIPRTWTVRDRDDAEKAVEEADFPCALKPRRSHEFQRHFAGTKMWLLRDRSEMMPHVERALARGVEVFLTEYVRGPEDSYCSYYSYFDESGNPMFDFTKRKLRQFPVRRGLGTYHMTDWNPEVAALGLRFLQAARVRGPGNVEFKRDVQDGSLKLIEANLRFTQAHELMRIAGLDYSRFVYQRLTGGELPPMTAYRKDVRVLCPIEDFRAFLDARGRSEISLGAWVRSLLHRQHLLVFRWNDPGPTIGRVWVTVQGRFARLTTR